MIQTHIHQEIKHVANLEKGLLLRFIVSGIGILFLTWISMLIQFGKPPSFSHELYYWAGLTLTTPILYFAGLPFLRVYAPHSLFRLSIDTPLMVTLISAYFYSLYTTLAFSQERYAYFDSILVIIFIVYASRYLEIFCQRRIRKIVHNLGRLPSNQVKIMKADEQFHPSDINDIKVGDKLYIAPGECFAVDGFICDSNTSVDESMLTGEAHAIAKFTNEKVRAGTYNLDKAVIIQATSIFSTSYFGKILSSIPSKPAQKCSQLPCDHLALWHLLIALTFAGAIYCWWLPFDNTFALFCTICVLLISCPCVIAISYPLITAILLEIGAKKGILITNPLMFLKFPDMDQIVFDKTGTLTEGSLAVAHIEFCNQAQEQYVLPLIAAIEKNTHHPIAHAIVKYAIAQFSVLPTIEIHRLQVFPGNGIRALVDGKFVFIGSAKWLRKNGIFVPSDVINAQEDPLHRDHIFVHCAIGGLEVARIQLKDKLRQDATNVIQFLKKRNIEIQMLSGDRPVIVNAIAKQLGAIAATAQALPQEKEAQILSLQEKGYITAMVGDGLNDARALQRADIGITMGESNPISLLCADIILQNHGLKLIPECFRLSIAARKILKQNYLLALIFNLSMLPFAMFGQLTPLLMLMGVCLNTLLVMANTARLKFLALSKEKIP